MQGRRRRGGHQLPAYIKTAAGTQSQIRDARTDFHYPDHVLGTSLHGRYALGGVAYAQKLPDAISFGPNRDDLPTHPSDGDAANMANEAVRIRDLPDAVKIYALSFYRIDPMF